MKKRAVFTLATFIAAVLTATFVFFVQKQTPRHNVTINETTVRVEIADSSAERTRGLSNRPSLEADKGMLFVWDAPGRYGIWMKDMQFPLDIIWIGANKRVVDITKNATPTSYPQVFEPRESAQYILEVNAGFADQHSISTNTPISF